MSARTTTPTRVPDAGDEDLYQTNVAALLADAPPWEPRLRPYAHYKPFPGEEWDSFRSRIDASLAAAAAANDPSVPVWDPRKFPGIAVDEPSDQQAMEGMLTQAFHQARDFTVVGHDNDLAHRVMERLAELAGQANLLPQSLDPAVAEFAWSPVRMVFAATGPAHHAAICRRFSHEPGFPWDPNETPEQWRESIRQAHSAIGWPTTVSVLRWASLNRIPKAADGALPTWVYWKAWVHVLTHLRWDEVEQGFRVTYNGKCVLIVPEPGTTLIGQQRRTMMSVLVALGCVSDVQKRAVEYVCARITNGHLLTALSLGRLPYTVIAGPWSRLTSDRSVSGWSEANARVTNAWVAHSMKVVPEISDEEAVLQFAWNVHAMGHDMLQDLGRFTAGVPATFAPVLPGDILEVMFPNLTDGGIADVNARKVLIELALVADILREDCPCLFSEYPYVAILPDEPTLEASVNQGKTTFCMQYAKASVPGLASALKYSDTSSAPDQRAIAAEIRQFGTVCLDEFALPKMSGALLSRSNLASLTVGMPVIMGKVMSNDNEPIRLQHPLFVSAKALDLTEDLLTRGLFIFLRQFTEAERNRSDVWESLKTAQLSIMLRLGALAFIEQHGLVAKLNAMRHDTVGFRYGAHKSLGVLLYQLRTGCSLAQAQVAFVAAVAANRSRMMGHTRLADDQGVIISMRDNRDLRITLEQVFADLTATDVQMMKAYMDAKGSGFGANKRVSMAQLMRARMTVDGRQDQALGAGFNQLTNYGAPVGDRLVSSTLAAEVKRRVMIGTAWRLPGIAGTLGWFLYHFKPRKDGCHSVTLIHESAYAAHETLVGDVDSGDPPDAAAATATPEQMG